MLIHLQQNLISYRQQTKNELLILSIIYLLLNNISIILQGRLGIVKLKEQ